MDVRNLFRPLPDATREEVFEDLLAGGPFVLERITSLGQTTPESEWLSQDRSEWVILLSGRARLRFEGEPAERELSPGDHLLIPAHVRHRVTFTEPGAPTVWLALNFHGA